MPDPPLSTKAAAEGKPVHSPMEAQVQKLADKVWKKYQTLDESQRYLIAIAGIPGSGKTTFAASLAYHLNESYQNYRHQIYPNSADYNPSRNRGHHDGLSNRKHISNSNSQDVAYVLPMDGYHLTRAHLSAMPNSEEAHYRRGAAFTFDAQSYLTLVEKLRKPIEPDTKTIWAPSFDHEVKDPVENNIPIPPTARIVIIEGLYVALSYPDSMTQSSTRETQAAVPSAWAEACALMDEIWLISVPVPIATERVARRNFKAGLSPSYEAALKRTMENDMENAKEILANLPPNDRVTERIESIEDEEWKSQEQKEELDEEETRKQQEDEEYEAQRLKMDRIGSIAEMADAGVGM